jgi:hypothetical protein
MARDLRHLLEIVGGAVRNAAEDDLLRGASRQCHDHPVEQLLPRLEVTLLFREVQDVAERGAARDDRRLLGGVADEVRHQRVAALVVGEDALLLVGDDAPLLQARDDPLERVVEIRMRERRAAVATGGNRRLVADVLEIGAGKAGRLP